MVGPCARAVDKQCVLVCGLVVGQESFCSAQMIKMEIERVKMILMVLRPKGPSVCIAQATGLEVVQVIRAESPAYLQPVV